MFVRQRRSLKVQASVKGACLGRETGHNKTDGLVQVAISGGDHADVDGNLAMIADSADGSVGRPARARTGAGSAGRLQHSQQLGLRLQIAFADFVQKQRAAVGQLEGSLAVAIGSGERPFDMAEEFRFQQGL